MAESGFWTANLDVLRSHAPMLARQVEAAPVVEGVRILPTPSGMPTLEVPAESGEPVLMHSRYDPVREAERGLADLSVRPLETYVVLGFGLGYVVSELLRRIKPESSVLLVEKDVAFLRAALEARDLRDILADPRVHYLIGKTGETLYGALREFVDRLFAGSVTFVPHPPSQAAFPAFYEAVRKAIGDLFKSGALLIRTRLILARQTAENRLGNLVEYVTTPGILPHFGAARGFPAIIASAGPSLAQAIPHLPRARDQAAILAVSTAFKGLLDRGIEPDFTFIVDYHAVSARYFDRVAPGVATPLVTDAKASAEAVAAYSGPKCFFEDPGLSRILAGFPLPKGAISSGATVAHLAFTFAEYLGAARIVLTGQDLCYPHNVTHVPGTAIYTRWQSEINPFHTYEMKEWESIRRLKPALVRIQDTAGRPVYTDDNFFAYLKDFELFCTSSPAKCYNASEGGAHIAGAEPIALPDFLSRHTGPPLPRERLKYTPLTADQQEANLRRTRECCARRLDEGRTLRGLYRKTVEHLERARDALDAGRPGDSEVRKVLKLKTKIDRYDALYHLYNELAPSDVMLREQRDRTIKARELSGPEKQREQIERNLEFLSGMKAASEYLEGLLEGTVGRLETRLAQNSA